MTREHHRDRLRRSLIAGVVLTLLALLVASCGDDNDSDATAGEDGSSAGEASVEAPGNLVQDGVLTLGTDFTYPPYEYIDGNEQKGFDVELAEEIGEVLGLEINMVDTRFNSLIPGLRANRFDAIQSALYITEDRAKQVDYVPYFTTGNSIVVKADGDYKPKEPEDLCGHTVAILQGSDIEDITRNEVAPKCSEELVVRSFPTDTEAFQEVASGRADALFTDSAVAAERVRTAPQLGMEVSSEKVLFPVPVGLAVREGDTEMKEALTAALAELESSGVLGELLEKYGLEPVDEKLVDEALAGEE